MNQQSLMDYGLQKPGASLKYPFGPETPVLFVGSKMFALFGNGGHPQVPSVNLKAEPEIAWLQRQQYPDAVLPGYHMNKRHWNTVLLNGVVPDEELLRMLDESYLLVRRNLPKRERESLDSPPSFL
ncbi:MmcQ/YjbR family DNA-binding protein [Paenibacillus ginsengihumi]|uniref:MmcQ/YjbR family DNA-binding protein n=1 Tax=Paenibacillus ginsengihumi TaxID=431596 RepID=UPI000362F4B7|nr:MmcQ/YjbR family DNA-binding protein [Paenibacillus ginsengihumi]